MKLFIPLLVSVILLISSFAKSDGNILSKNNQKTNILVLLSHHTTLPWTDSFLKGLKEARLTYGEKIQFYYENMEAIRIGKTVPDKTWIDYLSSKYKNHHFHAVIAESTEASKLLNKYRDRLFTNTPLVYYSTFKYDTGEPDVKMISNEKELSIKKTLGIALQQNPKIKQIFIIDGQNRNSQEILEVLLPEIKKQAHLKINIIKDFSLDELIQKIAYLPKDSILFYNLVLKDKTGKRFVPKVFLSKLSKVSAVPIYSIYSPLVDDGIIGGHLIDGKTTSKEMVRAAMDYILNGHFEKEYHNSATYMDWNLITRYGIDPSLIPKDAIILNKPIPLWVSHFYEVLITAIFMTTLLILVALLLVLNFKLKRANTRIKTETDIRLSHERLLIQQTKMAEMGNMIGTIAHQWKQPLNALALSAQNIPEMVEYGEMDVNAASKVCDEMIKSIQFMNQTIGDFRDFYKPNKEKSLFKLHEKVQQVLNVIVASIKRHNLTINITGEDIEVYSIPNELEQVILNLIINAKDALKENNIADPIIDIRLSKTDKCAKITIHDNAGGIPEAIREKIFDPYFSTKGKEGTGVGLYMSKLIIEESLGGKISAQNKKDGAEFVIELPLANQ